MNGYLEPAVLLRALNNMAAFPENGSYVRHFQKRAGFGSTWRENGYGMGDRRCATWQSS